MGVTPATLMQPKREEGQEFQLSGTLMLYTTEDRRGGIVVIRHRVCSQRSERSSNSGRICPAKEGSIMTIRTIGLTSFLLECR